MRLPVKINIGGLALIASGFYILGLTGVGVRWEDEPLVRDVYLWIGMFMTALIVVERWADRNLIATLDSWMASVWLFVGMALVGLSAVWPVLLLAVILGATVRLVAKVVFQSFDEFVLSVLPDDV